MKSFSRMTAFLVALSLFLSSPLYAETFAEMVGNVSVGPVKSVKPVKMPTILWGGDYPTYYANGGPKTKPGSIFAQQKLDIELTYNDNFVQQVRDYMSGESPFLRGTFRMVAQASEVISMDVRTKGVVIVQQTWSNGDHMVVREEIKEIKDLAGKKVALQRGGPHVGMLDDVLKLAQLSWDDIEPIWCENLTGPGSPSEQFRNNSDISACFVITPDMIGLCGGLRNTGSGAEGTIKGSRVGVSSMEMAKSIADVIVCRKDFYDTNKNMVEKFVAGYLKGVEELIDLAAQYDSKGSDKYFNFLEQMQGIYGQDALPTIEEDAHGLFLDAKFAGHPGNVKFFTDKNNPNGFKSFERSSLTLMQELGLINIKNGFFPPSFDWNSNSFIGYLAKTEVKQAPKFNAEALQSEIEALNSGELDANTIFSMDISFEANQQDFSSEVYGAQYHQLVEAMQKASNAVVVIRGHADPSRTLLHVIKAGMQSGIIKQHGNRGNYSYTLNGRPLDLNQTKVIAELIQKGHFDSTGEYNPLRVYTAAMNLSKKRADNVKESIVSYASSRGLQLDNSQIQPQGIGINDPVIPKPRNSAEAAQNMIVEFRLIRVSPETMNPSDFDF